MAKVRKISPGRPIYGEEKGQRLSDSIRLLSTGQIEIVINVVPLEKKTCDSCAEAIERLDGQINIFRNPDRIAVAGHEYTAKEKAERLRRYEGVKQRILAKQA